MPSHRPAAPSIKGAKCWPLHSLACGYDMRSLHSPAAFPQYADQIAGHGVINMKEDELRNRALAIIDRVVPKQGKSVATDPQYAALWSGYKPPANGTSCGHLPGFMVRQLMSSFGVSAPKGTQRWLGNGGVDVKFMLSGQIDNRLDAYVKAGGSALPKPGDIYWISGSGALHVGVVLSADNGAWVTADAGAERKGESPTAQRRTRQYLGGALSGESQQGVRMVPLQGWADIGKYFRAEPAETLLAKLIRMYGS